MSELKVIKIELNNHGKPIASIQGTTSYYGISPNDTFYPKSEADKVIAEKDKEIAELQKQVHDYAQGLYVIQEKAEKEICHHKYKRCLAMAEVLEHVCPMTNRKAKWRDKWHKRWLTLADKYKDGNV